ncbi:MAG: hypothetical protein KatS3mg054_0152 [Chloroflexus sp.]|nr:MAG: hypothetical protein KatS3mg054_0152 [Chloroflexus sp.]
MTDPEKVLLEEAMAGNRVLLVGPPGCGKTARIKAVAQKAGYKFVLTVLHLKDRVDLGGAIVPDLEAGMARELPLELVANLKNSTEPILWFVDDLGKAPIDVQGALKSLVTRDGIGANLPQNVVLWGATNRPDDGAGVRGLDESLRSEFDAAYEVQVPLSWNEYTPVLPDSGQRNTAPLGTWDGEKMAWARWAMSQADTVDPDWVATVLGFMANTNYRWLYEFKRDQNPAARNPDYRSWASVLRLPASLRQNVDAIAARVGRAAASALASFAVVAGNIPSAEEILADPDKARVPEPSQVGALMYVSVLLRAWAKPASETGPGTIKQIVRYMARLPLPFAAVVSQSLASKWGLALAKEPAWQEWFEANSDIFA